MLTFALITELECSNNNTDSLGKQSDSHSFDTRHNCLSIIGPKVESHYGDFVT